MKAFWIIPAFVVLLLLLSSFYVVGEQEQVIITQFGEPVGDPIVTPGLKAKIPFVQAAHRFDKRFLEWDGDANELPTKDKRFIYVDTYARWRITDPLKFFQRLRDERGAQSRLDDILDGETRNSIANHNLVEVIRTTNRKPAISEDMPDESTTLEEIKVGRENIRQEVLANAQSRTQDLGIEILDVQFKRINYTEEVRRKVYERMISERLRIADRYRSEGEGEAARIKGEKERELQRIRSEAYREAEGVRGRADAKATAVYAQAYDRSPDSRSFYSYLKTMETYLTTFDEGTTVVLGTNGEFYRPLKRSTP